MKDDIFLRGDTSVKFWLQERNTSPILLHVLPHAQPPQTHANHLQMQNVKHIQNLLLE